MSHRTHCTTSCTTYSPCHLDTCHTCNPVNDCYDNCGCLNPTTFSCVTNPSANYENIPLLAGKTGSDLLINLDATIEALKEAQYKVKIDEDDTCPTELLDKFEAGTNISIEQIGTGCDKKILITAGEGIGAAGADIKVKASSADTTANYLYNKLSNGTFTLRTILSPGGNETVKYDVVPSTLISTIPGNVILSVAGDGALAANYDDSGNLITLTEGAGIKLVKSGNDYVISTLGTISPVAAYADNVWRNISVVLDATPNVTITNPSPIQYRIRWDKTIEFRGNLVCSVVFNTSTSNKRTISANFSTIGGGTNNIPSAKFDKDVDMKYVADHSTDGLSVTAYTIRMKTTGILNIVTAYTGSVASPVTKTIVVSFDGCVYHPDLS